MDAGGVKGREMVLKITSNELILPEHIFLFRKHVAAIDEGLCTVTLSELQQPVIFPSASMQIGYK